MRIWWRKKSGGAKAVTALAILLVLQIGLCFASPGEPAWFVALFQIRRNPDQLRLGLIILEAYGCLFTFALLLIVLLVCVTTSWSAVDDTVSVVPRGSNGADDKRTNKGK